MLSHLLECRRRLLQIFSLFALLWMLFFYYSSTFFTLLTQSLIKSLPVHDSLIATNIITPIVTPMRLAADLALLSTTPYALWHLWKFASPGLYRTEQQCLKGTLCASLTLFMIGVLFCFYGVLPYLFSFFANALPSGVQFKPDMQAAVDFITHMLLIFGLCFQLPLLCFLLVRFRHLKVTSLARFRPYMYVLAFTIGMLLTPPDVVSQIMLAVPLCLLYEISVQITCLFHRRVDHT